MRIITKEDYREIRIGVRRDAQKDGLAWRIFVYPRDVKDSNEDIPLKIIVFNGSIETGSLTPQSDLTRENEGGFLAWLDVKPKRIEIDNDIAQFFF